MNDSAPGVFGSCVRWLARPAGLALLAVAGVALAYLVYEHRLHVLALLPYLLILACPLMHLFHHHGHRHGGHGHGGAGENRE